MRVVSILGVAAPWLGFAQPALPGLDLGSDVTGLAVVGSASSFIVRQDGDDSIFHVVAPGANEAGPIDIDLRGIQSDSVEAHNTALVHLDSGDRLACELADTNHLPPCSHGSHPRKTSCHAIECFTLRETPEGLEASAPTTLYNGSYPSFPESVFLAAVGGDSAILCWQEEFWEESDSTSRRKDKAVCRHLTVGAVATGTSHPTRRVAAVFSQGPSQTIGGERGADAWGVGDFTLAPFDENAALACYATAGRNRCHKLTVAGTTLSLHGHVDLGARRGSYTASPCLASRLSADSTLKGSAATALACCEETSWWFWRKMTCQTLDASGDLLTHGVNLKWSKSVWSPLQTITPDATVHLSDADDGMALVCSHVAQRGDDEVSCVELGVRSGSWWWWWTYLEAKKTHTFERVDATRRGFFAVDAVRETTSALACYRATSGSGMCRWL